MDVEVDTGLLRAAGEGIGGAADALLAIGCVTVVVPHGACGGSPAGVEATDLLRRRANEAAGVPVALAGAATDRATALRVAAAVFDQLEAGLGGAG